MAYAGHPPPARQETRIAVKRLLDVVVFSSSSALLRRLDFADLVEVVAFKETWGTRSLVLIRESFLMWRGATTSSLLKKTRLGREG